MFAAVPLFSFRNETLYNYFYQADKSLNHLVTTHAG